MNDGKSRHGATRGRKPTGAATTTVTTAGLLRKTVYFDEDEWQAIRRRAYERDCSYTEVIREAVRRLR